jgi:RNA polymerase sigma-70 factor (family 1)
MESLSEDEFVKLYAEYFNPLKKFVFNLTSDTSLADDIVQDSFEWLWESRDKLSHVTTLRPYLYSVVKHKVFNHLRHRIVRRQYSVHLLTIATHETIDLLFELDDVLKAGLKRLTKKEREVFVLSRHQHLSNMEIAAMLNVSQRTIENHVTRGLKKLSEYFKN